MPAVRRRASDVNLVAKDDDAGGCNSAGSGKCLSDGEDDLKRERLNSDG